MKRLYRKLAWMGIKNNRQLYIPYIIMGICVVSIYYILDALARKDVVISMSSTLSVILYMGMFVILVFSLSYLLYTNSFLMKRRMKEFGLYNILGMNKKNLSGIIFWENGISGAICIAGGVLAGMLLEKFCEVCLCRFVHEDIDFAITFNPDPIIRAILFYTVLFSIILVKSLITVRVSNPIELVKSENMGEKPVKANWVFAVLGAAGLVWAYSIAILSSGTLAALRNFFFAVVLVIISTNLLFVAGSVALCKLLGNWKKYYYKANHFVSVSSMSYRMRRNGVGLSVICILATMVMVMITGSGCLFFGEEESVRRQHPMDSHIMVHLDDVNRLDEDYLNILRSKYAEVIEKHGVEVKSVIEGRYLESAGVLEGNRLTLDGGAANSLLAKSDILKKLHNVYIIDRKEYFDATGTDLELAPGETYLYTENGKYSEKTLNILELKEFTVKGTLDKFPFVYSKDADLMFNSICMVVNSLDEFAPLCFSDASIKDKILVIGNWYYGWNDNIEDYSEELNLMGEMVESVFEDIRYTDTSISYNSSNIHLDRDDFYKMYGGLFFLGIILSIVFIIATVLIIYYKQISEGYEDQKRFEIMQKVGMTKKDIKRSVNSQMLTVFFFPPFLAVVHLCFATPMMFEMLKLFGVQNTPVLLGIAAACVSVFAIGYVIVYKITSNTYYRIVSGEHI